MLLQLLYWSINIMSSEHKLNKYLHKLKSADNIADSKIYFAKILKYKHIADTMEGGTKENNGTTTNLVENIKKTSELLKETIAMAEDINRKMMRSGNKTEDDDDDE